MDTLKKWEDPEYRKSYFHEYNARRREQQCEYGKQYRVEHRDKRLLQSRTYMETHREEAKRRAHAWYQSHPQQAKESRHRWHDANREKVRAYNIRHRTEHLDEMRLHDRQRNKTENRRAKAREFCRRHYIENRARVKEWARNNPEKARINRIESTHRRRCHLASTAVEHVNHAAIYLRDKGRCGICGKKILPREMSLDHILPISRGGCHAEFNVQLAHISCNKAKGAGRLPSQLRLPI